MNKELGKKIKKIRTSKGMTLKDLSEKTNLSIGFLSLVERGLASTGIMSLQNIAQAFGVDLGYFFSPMKGNQKKRIVRSYDHDAFRIENSKYVYFSLAGDMEDKRIDPMLVVLLPGELREEVAPFCHEGEEFVYVLEGIVTVIVDNNQYILYPGDSIQIHSNIDHNWVNHTNKIAKILSINLPNPFINGEKITIIDS